MTVYCHAPTRRPAAAHTHSTRGSHEASIAHINTRAAHCLCLCLLLSDTSIASHRLDERAAVAPHMAFRGISSAKQLKHHENIGNRKISLKNSLVQCATGGEKKAVGRERGAGKFGENQRRTPGHRTPVTACAYLVCLPHICAEMGLGSATFQRTVRARSHHHPPSLTANTRAGLGTGCGAPPTARHFCARRPPAGSLLMPIVQRDILKRTS